MEVFAGLQLNSEMENLLREVIVTKVATNPSKDFLRVYIESGRILPKKSLYDIEELLSKRLFQNQKNKVTIIEKFKLSSQYTPQNLYQYYEDSIEVELRTKNPLLLGIFHAGEFVFDEGGMVLFRVPGNVISQELEEDFLEYLHKVFSERCGLNCRIEISYFTVDRQAVQKEKDEELRIKIDNMLKGRIQQEESQEKSQEEKAEPAPKESRSVIHSNNPDVVYGRDL